MKRYGFLGTGLIILSLIGVLAPILEVRAGSSWSSSVAVQQNDPYTNVIPSALQASNGTVWLAWQTNRYRGDSSYDIAYKTGILGTGGVAWSSPSRFTNNFGFNAAPSFVQLQNGTILLFWTYKGGSSYQVYYERYNGAGWSNSMPATSTTLNDTYPSSGVGRDGTLWLVWTRENSTCLSCGVTKQLYYETLKGNVWSSQTRLTSDANWNFGSNVIVGKDGLVRVVWSKGQNAPDNFQIYYKTYNGTVWSSETQIVTSTSEDISPSLLQDRNGTLWVFWARKIILGAQLFYYVLYSKYSIDNGQSWSAETPLTNTPTTVDSYEPSAIQSANDKKIWLFYSTDPTGIDFQIWALTTINPISPVCDVAVYSFNPVYSPSNSLQFPGGLKSVGQSALLTVNVTLANRGDSAEIVSAGLTIYNATIYNLQSSAYINPGGFTNLLFKWNTTGVKPARYSMKAVVSILTPACPITLGNQGDATLSGKNVTHIIPLTDIDQDGYVDLNDIAVFFYAYAATPGTPRWNPYCDLNNQGYIDLNVIAISVYNYGIRS